MQISTTPTNMRRESNVKQSLKLYIQIFTRCLGDNYSLPSATLNLAWEYYESDIVTRNCHGNLAKRAFWRRELTSERNLKDLTIWCGKLKEGINVNLFPSYEKEEKGQPLKKLPDEIFDIFNV